MKKPFIEAGYDYRNITLPDVVGTGQAVCRNEGRSKLGISRFDKEERVNHLILKLSDNTLIYLASGEYSDSALCRDGGMLMGTLWDKRKVVQAATYIDAKRED